MPLFNPNTSTNTCTAYIKPGLEQNVNRWKFEGKFDSNGDYPQEAIHKAVEKLHEHTEKLTTSIPQTDQTIIDALTKIKAMASSIEAGMIGNDGSGKASYSEYYVREFMTKGLPNYEKFIELATQEDIPLPLRENTIKNLACAQAVCADGILSNIEIAIQELTGASRGLPAHFCQSLIQSIDTDILLALKSCRKTSNFDTDAWGALAIGNEIHTVNQIFNIIAPHFGLEQRTDSHRPATWEFANNVATRVKSEVTENGVIIAMADACLESIHNLCKIEGLVPGASYTCEAEYDKATAIHDTVQRKLSQLYGTIDLGDYILLADDALNFSISTNRTLIEKRIIKNLKQAQIIHHKSGETLGNKGDTLRIKKLINSLYVVESQSDQEQNIKTYSSLQNFLQESEEHVRKIKEKLAQYGSVASNIFDLDLIQNESVLLTYDTIHLIRNNQIKEAIEKHHQTWVGDRLYDYELGNIIISILKNLSAPEYRQNCREFIQLLPHSIIGKVATNACDSPAEFLLFYQLLSNEMIHSGVGDIHQRNQSIISYALYEARPRKSDFQNLLKAIGPTHYPDLVNHTNNKPAISFAHLELYYGQNVALEYFKLLMKYREAGANFTMEGFFEKNRTNPIRKIPSEIILTEISPTVELINYVLADIASKDLEKNFNYIATEIEKTHSRTLVRALAVRMGHEEHSPPYYINFIKKLNSENSPKTPEPKFIKHAISTLSSTLIIDPSELFTSSINDTPDTKLLEILIDRNCSSAINNVGFIQRRKHPNKFPPGNLVFWLNFTLNRLAKSNTSNKMALAEAFDDIFSHAALEPNEFEITNAVKFSAHFSKTLTSALSLRLTQTAVRLMEMANSVEPEGFLSEHDKIIELIEKHGYFKPSDWYSIQKFAQKYLGANQYIQLMQRVDDDYDPSDAYFSDTDYSD